MRYLWPKSFLTLILIGFSFVSLPLVTGIVTAAVGVSQLADISQRALYRAVRATQDGRILAEQITSMERTARQFQVLGEDALLQRYMESHLSFHETIEKISRLALDRTQRTTLDALAENEQVLFEVLRTTPVNSKENPATVEGFELLAGLAQTLLLDSYKLIDREVYALEETANASRQRLIWQALTVIPLTVVVAALFTVLISRPMSQIDHAIRRLGDGEFSTTISVAGPRDIESLGQRLNWLRTRLLDVEEEKDRFLRHVSHELKTPLAAIREGSELLAEEIVGPLQDQQREVTHILRDSSQRLQRLIENLLNYHVAHERNAFVALRTVSMNDLIEKVVADHRLAIMGKELDVKMKLEPVLNSADPEKLKAIIDNLVSNAVKFSPAKGQIHIALHQKGNEVILDLKDAGPGIRENERNKIFDAFFQGQAVHDGYVDGTGLGLSIAKEYVLAHKGTIELVGHGGRGAHFRVTLPTTHHHSRS